MSEHGTRCTNGAQQCENVAIIDTLMCVKLILYSIPNIGCTIMSTESPAETVDVKGQNCPMPVIKTKGAFDSLEAGETLEVVATDSGSMSDIKGWADSTADAELLSQEEATEDGEAVYKHYIQKAE